MFWKKKQILSSPVSYDKENWKPVIKCSICNGEQVAGFKNIHTNEFKEECLLRNSAELQEFKTKYGILGDVEKIY